MRDQKSRILLGAALWLVGVFTLAQAQTTTVAGTMAGQFAVNESGAGTYRIPIQVPPGVAGMEPKLELSYNSQGGNGLLGMGWSLGGLSTISRCPRTKAQDNVRGAVNYDMNDRYCLDGQRLILVSGTYGVAGSEYRTELDSFSRIIASGTAGNGVVSFTVQSKAGLTMEYGNTVDSRIEAQGKPTVRVWAINKISDVKTNFMTLSYIEDNANGEFYPNRIDYSGNVVAGQAASNSVRFVYEARPDASAGFLSGSLLKLTQRMIGLNAYTGSLLVKSYAMQFEQGPSTTRTRLISVRDCEGPAAISCRAPLQLTWTDANSPGLFNGWSSTPGLPGRESSYAPYLADVNGDGLPDLVEIARSTNGGWISINPGDANFQGWSSVNTLFGGENGYTHHFVDVNGDGLPDAVQIARSSNGGWISINPGDGNFQQWTHTNALFAGADSYAHYWADLNGDGLLDFIQIAKSSNGGWISINPGNGNFQGWTYTNSLFGGEDGYAHYLVDVNGDGLPDMVQIARGTNGGWISINPGNGNFQGWTYTNNLFGGEDGYAHYLADVNGDGLQDVVQIARGVNAGFVSINPGSGDFQQWTYTTNIAGGTDAYTNHLIDVNGDGLPDLVQIAPTATNGAISINPGNGNFTTWTHLSGLLGSANTYSHYLSDLDGDGLPDLFMLARSYRDGAWISRNTKILPDLVSVASSVTGVTTSFVYSPLTKPSTYTKDTAPNASAYPKADLVYPQYVVSSIASSNGVGGTITTQYSYGGLKAELGTGRGMLGFRWMKSKNLSNNIESYTEFNQNWPFTGSVAKSETRLAGSGNAGVLKRTTNTYAQGTGSATGTTFVYPSQSVEESWDLTGTPYPTVTNSYQYGQSPQFGDPTQITVGNSAGASKSTVNEYWPANTGSGSWVLGRLKKATVTSVTP